MKAQGNVRGRERLIPVARGISPADILFEHAELFNPFTGEWSRTDFAVKDGIVVGTGRYRAKTTIDLKGRRVVPALIDAHVHIESSLLSPPEYARLVARHGTTTVIADPHEIANVCGADGLEFMLGWRGKVPIDLFFMLPSCVPATPLDRGGAVLGAGDLRAFAGRDGVIGLGEVMNVPGVLSCDPEVMEKIALLPIVDGHAPLLSGQDLTAYILAGVQSDHESTGIDEAREKLERGMFLYIREGSTEKNIRAIIPLVTPKNASRCSFCTDDRHADLLVSAGHIDDCIRRAVGYGLEEEIAIRMATLSPTERFSLHDRGALSPGRIADFCLLAEGKDFTVEKTFRGGVLPDLETPVPCPPLNGRFACDPPRPADIALPGSGPARVIGLVPHQIITESLTFPVNDGDIPDTGRDILKAVVCSRYRKGEIGTALVHGFGIESGAIAGSVSHDSHNIVAVGADDTAICRAIGLVIRNKGGLVVVDPGEESVLPLSCAGLMSVLPYGEVNAALGRLNRHVAAIGGRDEAFMYLSFLALTVIPALRVTERGLFDVEAFSDVPVFLTDDVKS
jgi:adenine deaminase